MTTSRHKVLGLALMAVLGLMAIGATGAQALTKGVFLLDKKAPAVGSTLTGAFEKETGNILHSTFGANNEKVLLSCKKLKVAEGKFLNEKEGLGKVEFSECTVEVPSPACKVAEPIVAEAILLALLHKPAGGVEETYIVAHPDNGGAAFTTLHFSGCILPEEVPIKGLPVFKDCENTMLTDKETHLIEEVSGGLGLEAGEGLKFGSKVASTLGSVLVSDPGHTWAAH